jgi:hypothetical protein
MTIQGRIAIARLVAALAAGAILFAAAGSAHAERKTPTGVPQAKITDRTQQPSPTRSPCWGPCFPGNPNPHGPKKK